MKRKRILLISIAALLAVAVLGFAVWLFTLPPAVTARQMPAIAQQEAQATLAALKPPKRARPLIAIVGLNDGTEVTDYLMPYGIIRRADVADIVLLAAKPGPVSLFPALKVDVRETMDRFDRFNPEGADYVLVPQMLRDDDPVLLQWLKDQAKKGAIIIGVCAGARIVANTGLLDGKRATTHWFYVDELRSKHPLVRYVPDRRLVADKGVATTTGITASMILSLTLIEAIAGREKADSVARELGLPAWDARHDGDAFRFNRRFALAVTGNVLAFWRRESRHIALKAGIDEVSLALVADAWSRTYRSRALTVAAADRPVLSQGGVRILPDEVSTSWSDPDTLLTIVAPPAMSLDRTLTEIASRYGDATAYVVAMQMEYPLARR